eukprot:scaffold14188_cov50-Attheya_sp.AAC.7
MPKTKEDGKRGRRHEDKSSSSSTSGKPYDKDQKKRRRRQEEGDHSRRGASVDDTTAPIRTFDDLNLKPSLLKGIYSHGFERPSAIQQRAIRPILRGRDVIAQSQSGTGKTAVFSIAALQLLDERSSDPQ